MNSMRMWDRLQGQPRTPVPPELRPNYDSLRNGCPAIGCYFEPEAVQALNWLVSTTQATVVISSTWRNWSLHKLHAHFVWQGYTGPRFYSRTPDVGFMATGPGHPLRAWHRRHGFISTEPPGSHLLGMSRGQEIDTWLTRVGQGRVASFVILDDEAGSMAPHCDRLVQTCALIGLTMNTARQASELLKLPI